MSPPQVLVTDAGAVLAAVVTHLEDEAVTVSVLEPGASAADAALAAAGVPVVIVGLLPMGAEAIGRLHGTGLLIRAGIGYDIIDIAAATSAGIWVANVPDFCVDEVADHTMLLLAAAMRSLPASLSLWRTEGRWAVIPQLPPIHRMRGKRLGLIGLGRIGRQVAVRARSFGWDVVAHDPFVDAVVGDADGVAMVDMVAMVGLDELLTGCDAVSLHCPLTEATMHLVDAALLDRLRPGTVLVNTSRGGLVDLDALYAAVDSGRVSVAALDVIDGEPTPNLDHPLLHHANVIVTPHVAWYSSAAQAELARNTATEALRFLRGERPRNLVNPEARHEPTAATSASTSTTEL